MSGTKLKDRCGLPGRNGLRSALALGFLVLGTECYADAPLAPPARHEICSSKMSACVEFVPGSYGVVRTRNSSADEWISKWHVPGWHRWGLLTNDGNYFVSCWTGGLVYSEPKETELVAGIYSPRGQVGTVQLGQVVESISQLRRTASHYYWGNCAGFDATEKNLLLETVSGKYSLSLATAEVKKL